MNILRTMLWVTAVIQISIGVAASANERSRAFEDCLSSNMIALQAASIGGDPNEAFDQAASTLKENGTLASISGMAASIETELARARSATEKQKLRLWLKWVADGIADEPIPQYQSDAKKAARSFEACIFHVYDIDLLKMRGWQDNE